MPDSFLLSVLQTVCIHSRTVWDGSFGEARSKCKVEETELRQSIIQPSEGLRVLLGRDDIANRSDSPSDLRNSPGGVALNTHERYTIDSGRYTQMFRIFDDLCDHRHSRMATCAACRVRSGTNYLMPIQSTTTVYSDSFYLIAVLLIDFSLPMWQITSLGQAIHHNRNTIRADCLEGGDSKVLWFGQSFLP